MDGLDPYVHPDDVQLRTSTRTFRPFITPDEEDELSARRSVHAGILPSNLAHAQTPNSDWYGNSAQTVEQSQRGWTAQQPFAHVNCAVMHMCVLCAAWVDPDCLRQHDCAVRKELEH